MTYTVFDATSGTASSGGNSITWSHLASVEGSDPEDYADPPALVADVSFFGWGGDGTIRGGVGHDVLVMTDGGGGDTTTEFDIADENADGFFNDQLALSGLTDASGNPVSIFDVTVVDDGFGNARLNFPDGEYIISQGVAPSQIDDGSELRSAGIACFL